MKHELEMTVIGVSAKDIEHKALNVAEAYFGTQVVELGIVANGILNEFASDVPRLFEATVIARRSRDVL